MVKKLFAFVLIFLLSSQNSAEAVFGSECKKPKSLINALQKQITTSQKSLDVTYSKQAQSWKTVVLNDALRKERYKSCMNPTNGISFGEEICQGMLAPYPKTLEECAVSINICNALAEKIYVVTEKIEKLKNDRAQIIVNNQKCFEPLQVVRAQEEVKY